MIEVKLVNKVCFKVSQDQTNAPTLIHSFGSALNEEPEISWTVNYSIVKVMKACFELTAASPRMLIKNHTNAHCNEFIDEL